MERVVGGGPDGEDGLVDGGGRCALLKCIRCAHVGRDVWVVTPGTRATKKRLSSGKALIKAWRDFCSEDFSLRTSAGLRRPATVGFLRPRLASFGITQRHS